MVGSLEEEPRELLLLLLLAFWREDSDFLADVLLMLGEARGDVDLEALRADLRDVRRALPRQLAQRHPARPDARRADRDRRTARSIRLPGVARDDRQGVRPDAAGRRASSTPTSTLLGRRRRSCSAASATACAARSTRSARSTRAQKLKLRATRLIEGIERLTGARPGAGLQIELRGSQTLEDAIRRAGRRIALAFAGGAALLAAVLAAAADSIDTWVPITLGVVAGLAGFALAARPRERR